MKARLGIWGALTLLCVARLRWRKFALLLAYSFLFLAPTNNATNNATLCGGEISSATHLSNQNRIHDESGIDDSRRDVGCTDSGQRARFSGRTAVFLTSRTISATSPFERAFLFTIYPLPSPVSLINQASPSLIHY